MADWDDAKKFKAETARTVVLALVGALATTLILKEIEKKSAYGAQVDSTKLSIKSKVVEEFLTHAYFYTSTASDACNGKAAAIDSFKNEKYDNYRNAANRLNVYFDGKLASEVKELGDKAKKLKDACNEPETVWEPIRQDLKEANNRLAIEALNSMALYK